MARISKLTSSQKGAAAEAKIAAEAIRLGMEVYRPIAEGGRCDLILGMADSLLRVQCKWAPRVGDVIRVWIRTSRHTPTRGYVQTTYSATEVDALGVYCADLDRCYLLPISLVEGRRAIFLRLAPARNCQKLGIHLAEKYELGAIAQLGERGAGSAEVAGSSPASSIAA
jgi:PD-(D/E)XK endonuclease